MFEKMGTMMSLARCVALLLDVPATEVMSLYSLGSSDAL